MKHKPSFTVVGLGITLLCVLIGELYRFHGYLLLDLWLPLFVGAWVLQALVQKRPLQWPWILVPALGFVGIGLSSLLIHSDGMSWGEVMGSALYGVRWACLFALGIMVFNESAASKKIILHMLLAVAGLLAIAGFIQLKLKPDFTDLEILGWDPHQGRLLSTWFDPNFMGGLFAFILPTSLALAWEKTPQRWMYLGLSGLLGIALLLTLSRSAYLALGASLLILGLLRSWKLLLIFAVIGSLAVVAVPSVQNRFNDLVDSASSVFTETYSLPDASARHRFGSWEEAWELYSQAPLLGQGYNRYEYAALELGTLKDTNIHSASGSDSSLLNAMATTGILGFLSFLLVYCIIAIDAFKTRREALSAGVLSGLAGLLIHCIFVNSLFFPLFLAPFWILIGLLPLRKMAS